MVISCPGAAWKGTVSDQGLAWPPGGRQPPLADHPANVAMRASSARVSGLAAHRCHDVHLLSHAYDCHAPPSPGAAPKILEDP